jgi:DNA invertase Pin-like site-specific DNA recombinase
MPAKRTVPESKSKRCFGQSRKPAEMLRAGLYARVPTLDQQTLPMQMRALREYAAKRGWTVIEECKDVGSGAVARAMQQRLIDSAWRRDTDVVLV